MSTHQRAVDTKLCEVCPGTLVSSTNKTDRHDITEILLKVALNIINPPHPQLTYECGHQDCLYLFGHKVNLPTNAAIWVAVLPTEFTKSVLAPASNNTLVVSAFPV